MEKVDFRIMLTSVGVTTSLNLIKTFRNQNEYIIKLIGADINPLSAGLHLCDKKYIVPPITHSSYLSKILQICDEEKVNLLIPLYSKEILLFSKNAKIFKDNGIELLISSPETIELCINKRKFLHFLTENNFPFPPLYETADISKIDFPVFIKPASGSGSKNTRQIHNLTQLRGQIRVGTEIIIQKIIKGKEYTIDLICDRKSKILAHAIRERIEVKAGLAIKCRTIKNKLITDLVGNLIKILGIIGPANVQIIVDTKGTPYIIEVNPRFAAGGLPLSIIAGANFPLIILNYIKGKKVEQNDIKEGLTMIRYYQEMYFNEGEEFNNVKFI